MINSRTILEHKIGERVYQFFCDPNSPLGELHDALIIMRNFVIQKMQEIDQKKEEIAPAIQCDQQCTNCEQQE
jgi:hypothetical protein